MVFKAAILKACMTCLRETCLAMHVKDVTSARGYVPDHLVNTVLLIVFPGVLQTYSCKNVWWARSP